MIFPVRRRISWRGGAAGFLISGRAPGRRGAPAGFFLFGRHRHLAGRGECGDLGRRRLARALGDLAPRFLLLAALRLVVRALARIFGGAATRLLVFDPGARFLFGAAAPFLDRAFFLLAPAIRLGQRGAAARLLVGLVRILHRAHPAGPLLGGQRPGNDHRPARRLGRLRARRRQRLARDRWRRLAASDLGRARADHALLAHLDGDRLGAPVRETLAYLPGFHTLAQLQPAAGSTQGQRPFLLLLSRVAHLAPIP